MNTNGFYLIQIFIILKKRKVDVNDITRIEIHGAVGLKGIQQKCSYEDLRGI